MYAIVVGWRDMPSPIPNPSMEKEWWRVIIIVTIGSPPISGCFIYAMLVVAWYDILWAW